MIIARLARAVMSSPRAAWERAAAVCFLHGFLCETAFVWSFVGGILCGISDTRCQIKVRRPENTQTAHPDLSYI